MPGPLPSEGADVVAPFGEGWSSLLGGTGFIKSVIAVAQARDSSSGFPTGFTDAGRSSKSSKYQQVGSSGRHVAVGFRHLVLY